MRWLSLFALMFVAAPVLGQENEAEKLVRVMEKNLREAKTFHLDFDGEILVFSKDKAAAKAKATATGKATFAEGNRCRIEGVFEGDGKKESSVIVSDGKAIVQKTDGLKTSKVKEGDGERWRSYLARTGVTGCLTMIVDQVDGHRQQEDLDIEKAVPLRNCKLAGKEQVGTSEAQVVTFWAPVSLKFPEPAKVMLWIDTKTQLPLKCRLDVAERVQVIRYTETYHNYALNPKVDAKLFELPK